MNNLFIDGSMDDSLFLDDIPGLLFDGEENTSNTSTNCGCDVKSMGKRYAYNVSDDIFPVSRSSALNLEQIEREMQAGEPVTTAIGLENIEPMYEYSHTEAQRENAEPTHCIGRSADCGDWLTMPSDIAPYSANVDDEYHFGDDDQAEHLSKMVGNRIRAELSTKSINSRIIEGRLTAVNENFLMIEQADTGASIAYDMNIFKYFMFLPETMAQEAKVGTNIHISNGIRKQNYRKNRYSNNTASNIQARSFNGTNMR